MQEHCHTSFDQFWLLRVLVKCFGPQLPPPLLYLCTPWGACPVLWEPLTSGRHGIQVAENNEHLRWYCSHNMKHQFRMHLQGCNATMTQSKVHSFPLPERLELQDPPETNLFVRLLLFIIHLVFCQQDELLLLVLNGWLLWSKPSCYFHTLCCQVGISHHSV